MRSASLGIGPARVHRDRAAAVTVTVKDDRCDCFVRVVLGSVGHGDFVHLLDNFLGYWSVLARVVEIRNFPNSPAAAPEQEEREYVRLWTAFFKL